MFPLFKDFTKFLAREANIACDPVTSLQNLRVDKQHDHDGTVGSRSQKRTHGGSSFSTGVVESKPKNENSCPLHSGRLGHEIDDCRLFLAKTMEERKGIIKDNGLCFGCLEKGHRSKLCKQRKTCTTCGREHPTSLHGDVKKPNKPEKKDDNKANSESKEARVSHLNDTGTGSKCSMIIPVWGSHRERPQEERLIYALLDTQSDTTFILKKTYDALGVDSPNTKLFLSTMLSKNQAIESQKIAGLMVRGYDSDKKIPLPVAFTREIMPANRSHIPTPEVAKRWPHLERISDKLMPLAKCEVGLLVGYNCPRALAPRDVIPPSNNEPYGQRTDLGWGIVGIVDPSKIDDQDSIGISHRVLTCEVPQPLSVTTCGGYPDQVVINPIQVTRMLELDFNERGQCDTTHSVEDRKFLEKVGEGIQLRDGHYQMPLPFRELKPALPNNKALALHRLKQLEARLKRDQTYRTDYTAFMDNLIEQGHAEKVPPSELNREDGSVWYIPHHGVYHPKKPGKIRVVFDCSAKFKGESLNEHLLQGPDLTNRLVGILCRMRQEAVAFMCDIEQMFHQFRVHEEHKDFLRFLWWEKGNFSNAATEYRMKVHLFGATSSPGCANFGLKQTANDNENEYGS